MRAHRPPAYTPCSFCSQLLAGRISCIRPRGSFLFRSGSETVHALLNKPAGATAAKHPAVDREVRVVGAERLGSRTRQPTAHGYVALAIDLYRGEVANDTPLISSIGGCPARPWHPLISRPRISQSSRKDVDPHRIGAVGWCTPWGHALSFAVADSKLKAVVANYGPPPTDPDSLAKIHAAILGNYGGLDKGIPRLPWRSLLPICKEARQVHRREDLPGCRPRLRKSEQQDEGNDAQDAADARTRYLHFFASGARAGIP